MFKTMMFTTAALAAVAAMPAAAQTNTTFTTTSGASAAPTGATTVLNFNSSNAVTEASGKGITLTSGGFSQQLSGSSFGSGSFDYAAPSPQDGGFYGIGGTTTGTVPQSFAQFSAASGQTFSNISVFIGSLDSYNAVQLLYSNGTSDTFTGTQLNGGTAPGFPGGAINTRASFTAQNGLAYTGVRLFNNTNQGSLEFDNLAFTNVSAVPEPASWAMMIVGLGMVGGTARRRRTAGKLAFA